ncbi:flagellar protein FlhE [Yersinia massiliensis]|uniref:flagellar protein FlhE n=1 Tax=Yersinia massiliensis TaxID=419257 RepID=UPI0005E877AC|nr:flagellar protein FlhE [Yersinia massiliensis]CNI15677.1 flagellar protein FlhE [Yersinia massiliensis]
MLRKIIPTLAALLLPYTSQAATPGSWSKESAGGHVSVGRQLMLGQPLHAPESVPKTARATRIQWHISLLTTTLPLNLQIKLCHASACRQLDGLSGKFTPDPSWPANGSYYFIYSVATTGQLRPPLRVVNNGITVNYQ